LPYPSDSVVLTTNVANLGNQDIAPFTVTGDVINMTGATVVSTSIITLDTLDPGQDSTITYPLGFTPTATGTYTYITSISGISGDNSASNDTTKQEIVVVDTSLAITTLTFTDNFVDTELRLGLINFAIGYQSIRETPIIKSIVNRILYPVGD
ncbi:MAG: hypothetical protein JKY53_13660, partial [Flavobacteriales bacterium]|nr:hypothetical protein [Flavobacteriales bacterium]